MALHHKYGAIRDEHDGFKFSSRAEGRYYLYLKACKAAGEVITFLMQTPFHLPGGVRYVADFLVFKADGTVHFIDVKGMETASFKAKRRLVETLYAPITIEVVKA